MPHVVFGLRFLPQILLMVPRIAAPELPCTPLVFHLQKIQPNPFSLQYVAMLPIQSCTGPSLKVAADGPLARR
jgi:hypothetical protein